MDDDPVLRSLSDDLERSDPELAAMLSGQDPHPFVISESAYGAFLNVISECSQAQLIRKGN